MCNSCSSNKEYVHEDASKKERCCDECFEDINRRKTISVPKTHMSQEEIAWMKNDSSKHCLLCESKFSMGNRRHHCRNCGILVCSKCSDNKIQLEDVYNSEPLPIDPSDYQRCCDACFERLQKLRQAEIEAKIKREQELALLNSTSRVDSSLIKLFFLDGSTKIVKYSESSTV